MLHILCSEVVCSSSSTYACNGLCASLTSIAVAKGIYAYMYVYME